MEVITKRQNRDGEIMTLHLELSSVSPDFAFDDIDPFKECKQRRKEIIRCGKQLERDGKIAEFSTRTHQ